MEFWFLLLASLGGGFFGAAIGANFAFVMVGFTLLAALGAAAAGSPELSTALFDYVAFGPFTGPHIAFAGGVGAAAYAARRGYLESGRDIVSPLAQLGKPDVLVVGGLFGALGFTVQQGVLQLPWFGTHTDAVAFTVIVSAFVARFAFGDRSLFNPEKFATAGGRFSPHEQSNWIRYQETPGQITSIGAFSGILAAGVSLVLATSFPLIGTLGNANTLPFAISAITICLLNMGYQVPVTHHITNIAGMAALIFYPSLAGASTIAAAGWNPGAATAAVGIGAVFGVIAGFLGELFARLFQGRGSTHIDPPAFAIWTGNTLIWVVAGAVGALS